MMDLLGDYNLQKELGSGPFGQVFLAEHRFIKRLFALKELPLEICQNSSFVRRFEQYIEKIAALDHPNIVKIHNVSFQEGRYFIVMDPVVENDEVMNLDLFLKLHGKELKEKEIENLLSQVASALDYAHDQAVFHGSLKPTNILIAKRDDTFSALLTDFSITRMIGEKEALVSLCQKAAEAISWQNLTQAGRFHRQFLQGFSFLAPEQKWLDFELVDARADSFAFGVFVYYLLLHKLPEGFFDLPSKVRLDLEKNYDLLIEKCLKVDPFVRPQRLALAIEESFAAKEQKKAIGEEIDRLKEEENLAQMAFSFQSSREELSLEAEKKEEVFLKPVLKSSEIERPEFEPDPGAIFQRETVVSHYVPKEANNLEIEPILTEMIIISGGNYQRGSSDGSRDEMPRHLVTLHSFALDVHPVTNEQFVRFLQVMGGEKDHNNNDIIRLRDSRIKRSAGKLIIESGYAKHPVVGVTWYGAVAYAKWIGKRLPTEAEWEIAAMGGDPQSIYPTGKEIERSQANFFSSDTTPVMSYPANTFGLYDMAGNVYEWCQDWYAYNYYESSLVEPDDPKGPHQGVYRVLRGGCWKSLKDDMRASHRHRNNPGAVNSTYGFRCAADVS